jgi:hypothetical protein
MIPERLLKCLDAKGFISEVQHRISNKKNMLQAYEELENEMQIHFGKRKYSDYATFRVTLSRETKKKNNPTKP